MSYDKYTSVAESLIFLGGSISEILKNNALELKDGKTIDDFKNAFKKGFNKQRGKTEIEVFNASEAVRKVCCEVKK